MAQVGCMKHLLGKLLGGGKNPMRPERHVLKNKAQTRRPQTGSSDVGEPSFPPSLPHTVATPIRRASMRLFVNWTSFREHKELVTWGSPSEPLHCSPRRACMRLSVSQDTCGLGRCILVPIFCSACFRLKSTAIRTRYTVNIVRRDDRQPRFQATCLQDTVRLSLPIGGLLLLHFHQSDVFLMLIHILPKKIGTRRKTVEKFKRCAMMALLCALSRSNSGCAPHASTGDVFDEWESRLCVWFSRRKFVPSVRKATIWRPRFSEASI